MAVIALVGGAVGIHALSTPELPDVSPIICTVPAIEPAPSEPEVPPEPEVKEILGCKCDDAGAAGTTPDEKWALELACRRYSDEDCRYPFEVVATPKQGNLTAVIVKRSTGDCGGCGAETVAASFDRGMLTASGPLGSYGRFGNGPDGARWVTVAGSPALELAWSESQGGYSSDYRTVFTRDDGSFKRGVCIETEWSDSGAHEAETEWKAQLRYHADGTIGVRYTSIKRGEAKPVLAPITIPFDREARTWNHDPESCVSPPRPDLIDI